VFRLGAKFVVGRTELESLDMSADRRNRLFEGLGTLSQDDLAQPIQLLGPRRWGSPVCLPWVEMPPFVDHVNVARIINAHIDATTLKPTRPDRATVQL
jgi:hypothetical protein